MNGLIELEYGFHNLSFSLFPTEQRIQNQYFTN